MKYKFWKRAKFLNLTKKDSVAQIITQIEDPKGSYPEGVVYINDCDRRIRLHGSLRETDSIKNFIYKLTVLIDELTKFRDYLVNVTQPKDEDK